MKKQLTTHMQGILLILIGSDPVPVSAFIPSALLGLASRGLITIRQKTYLTSRGRMVAANIDLDKFNADDEAVNAKRWAKFTQEVESAGGVDKWHERRAS